MKKISFKTPKERKNRTRNKNNKATDKSILFRFNLFISNPIVLTILFFLILIIGFLLANYVINFIYLLFGNLKNLIKGLIEPSLIFSFSNAFRFLLERKYIYVIVAAAIAVYAAFFVIKINISYKDFDVAQKGSDRWANIEELREQYKAIPMKDEMWESSRGGIIISRDGNKFLVDEEPGHNLVVGTTRSGKGEMFVKPNIEVLSRCSCKPSLIVAESKLDVTRSAYLPLQKRGYKVIVLNLIDPSQGDCYNPFSRIVALYKTGEVEKAYQESRAFAYSIFCSEGNSSKEENAEFWGNTATDLLSALIIGNVDDCLKLDEKGRAEAEYSYTCKRVAFTILSKKDQEEIYNQFNNGSLDIENAEALPPECIFTYEPRHEKEINMFSIFNSFRLMAENVDENGRTALDKYFKTRPLMDRARIFYSSINISGYKTKTSIYSNMITKLTAYSYDSLARMTSSSSFEVKDIGFGNQPLAIFIAVPDYDKSNHFFITTFVRQVYHILSSEASKTAAGKCTRPVWHILDEFGNIPEFENVEQMVSVGAGLNMYYNFIIQDFAQLDNKYNPNVAKIIRNNCQNQIFIKSNEYDTAEQFSKLLGNETITNLDRIGSRFALNKTYTERKEEKSLLSATELMALLEGEYVVKRVMKRRTLNGKDTVPYPIFNTGSQRMPYAHTYLPEFICNKEWTQIRTVFPPDKSVESFTFDIVDYYNTYVAESKNLLQQVQSLPDYRKLLFMLLGDGIYIPIQILKSRWIVELITIISENKDLSDKRKTEYQELIKTGMEQIKYANRDIIFK